MVVDRPVLSQAVNRRIFSWPRLYPAATRPEPSRRVSRNQGFGSFAPASYSTDPLLDRGWAACRLTVFD